MDKIQIGASFNIKRSDGRIHSAVITKIWSQKNAVLVEWCEGVGFHEKERNEKG